MALIPRTLDNKKRCQSTNMFSQQCTKRKNHPKKEIDVVHTSGVFVWRDSWQRDFLRGKALAKPGGPSLFDTPQFSVSAKPGFFSTEPSLLVFNTDSIRGKPAEKPLGQGASADRVIFDEMYAFRDSDPEPERKQHPEQILTEWWMGQATEEIKRTVPKAVEYSAVDLQDIGHDLARTMGREVSDEEAAELGVFFYLRGKVARWVGAVMAGERVSDDTLFDIGVYVRMAQRIRATGGWPGVEDLNG